MGAERRQDIYKISSLLWMRSSRVVRSCDFQCRSRNSPGFDPNILRQSEIWRAAIKGSLTRDFRLLVFFIIQCPPGPQVFHWGCFEFVQKFAEIFAINCSVVSMTPAKNLSPVSTTPAINPCHGEITKKPKIFRRCQRHRWKTVHRCQRHRR